MQESITRCIAIFYAQIYIDKLNEQCTHVHMPLGEVLRVKHVAAKEKACPHCSLIVCYIDWPNIPQRSKPDSAAMLMLEARRSRRQRKLDAVEISDDDVTVTDELLGKGGFGTVFMADYNGWNAAAKVRS